MIAQKNLKKVELLAIGDTANDIFITLSDDYTELLKNPDGSFLKIPYAKKIPFQKSTKINGVGNSPNAAVSATKLGISASLLTHIGSDKEGEETLVAFKEHLINPDCIIVAPLKKTNVHYVLHYKDDRTILIHHEEYNYTFKSEIENLSSMPQFIYLSSLSSGTETYHTDIVDYVNTYDIPLIFQPGTFQISQGYKKFQHIYESSLLVVVNVEEAIELINTSPWKKNSYNKKILPKLLHNFGQKLTIVTDGPLGCYLYDGNHSFYLPAYPDIKSPVERTGAGDAFASTVTAYLIKGYAGR